ncbi:hypothetical protein PV10_06451 [Exophiala mesophila]|uniref:Xylanolytic transcriptional activator regulatory domain-containing protein n=1 Tax=Exophiala mesophila TaxID=212818 RepID=A0A0D1XUS4_EXOME|nr:uncharacterized protein PV10_06451 [Exophiala mesophila]KIV91966.1 hypothetical protein PV10_06451 [Exophiala mesophila]
MVSTDAHDIIREMGSTRPTPGQSRLEPQQGPYNIQNRDHGPSSLDLPTGSMDLSQTDLSSIFNGMTPSAGFDFPTDLWFQGSSPLSWNVLAMELSPETERSKVGPTTVYGASPYASCPLFHDLDDGKNSSAKSMLPTCNFLQDSCSWTQIQEASVRRSKNDIRSVPAINHQVRDALVAMTHITLFKTLETASVRTVPMTFPPLETMQCLFKSCWTGFARLYPVIHPKTFDTVAERGRTGVTFPIFLQNVMILGALLLPVKEGQAFANDLGYLVRQTMHETMTQDVLTTDDVWMLSSMIIVTVAGAWSGNKVHVELAEAYRGIYTVMFNRRGYLKPQLDQGDSNDDGDSWLKWINRERKRRQVPTQLLCYIWYIVEQELSFFDCIISHISYTVMRSPMPCPDDEFFSETEAEWLAARQTRLKHETESNTIRPPSLAALYWLFVRDDFLHLDVEITPLQLRLLQCAIQEQILQHSQSVRFMNVDKAYPNLPSGASTVSRSTACAQLRLEEIHSLLVRWFILSKRIQVSVFSSEISVACHLMHHLISMELYICFEDVQCLAGKDGLEVGQVLVPQFVRWAKSPSCLKAISHAGEVIKILQSSMIGEHNNQLRPLWWPVALTRATLVLWSYGISDHIATRHDVATEGSAVESLRLISVNDVNEQSGPYGKVVQIGEGQPCLSNASGLMIPINHVSKMLDVALEILEDAKPESTPLSESILRFIQEIQRCGIPY